MNHDRNVKQLSETIGAQKARELVYNTAVRNAPHAQGTVSDIAEHLGVSKSEVRRLKRDGLLDAALKAHNQK